MELDASQNKDVENCEGDETLVDEADSLGNQSDIVAFPNFVPSSGVIPFPNVIPSSSETISRKKCELRSI